MQLTYIRSMFNIDPLEYLALFRNVCIKKYELTTKTLQPIVAMNHAF